MMACISADARASVTPSFMRPTAVRKLSVRVLVAGSSASGTHISPDSGKRNPFGMMPTTVRDTPPTWIVRPTRPGPPAIPPLPHAVAEDDCCLEVWLVLVSPERASEHRLHSKDAEEIPGDACAFDAFRLARPGEREPRLEVRA